MLEDFIDDLIETLTKRRQNEVDKLIAADGSGRHDLIRGRVSAIDETLGDVASLKVRYLREAA